MTKPQQAHDDVRAAHAKACRLADECAALYLEQLRERSRRADYWVRATLLAMVTVTGAFIAYHHFFG